MSWESSMEPYHNWLFGCSDNTDCPIGNCYVATQTRTWSNCPHQLLTLHMFFEHRLLVEEFNAFKRIAVGETLGIIIVKVLWISQMIVTYFARFPTFDAYHGHQQNVNRFPNDSQSSQTLHATSPVFISTSICSQTPLELRKLLSDSTRGFLSFLESTCSYGGAFWMLWDLT